MFIKSLKIFSTFMILFFIFSLQHSYVFTDNIGLKTMANNVPSLRGIVTHSFIFSIVLCILLTTVFNSKKDSDILSIRDDMVTDINQFLYLLTFDR